MTKLKIEKSEDKEMWNIYHKPTGDSRSWYMLCTYDNKAGALSHAYRVSGEYFLIKVSDPDGSMIWCN